jgi:hypothetical protein
VLAATTYRARPVLPDEFIEMMNLWPSLSPDRIQQPPAHCR